MAKEEKTVDIFVGDDGDVRLLYEVNAFAGTMEENGYAVRLFQLIVTDGARWWDERFPWECVEPDAASTSAIRLAAKCFDVYTRHERPDVILTAGWEELPELLRCPVKQGAMDTELYSMHIEGELSFRRELYGADGTTLSAEALLAHLREKPAAEHSVIPFPLRAKESDSDGSVSRRRIDFLLPLARWGGIERAVSMTAEHLSGQGYAVRVIQCIWGGREWLNASADFYCLSDELKDVRFDDFIILYTNFLLQRPKPDLLIAAVWPEMTNTGASARAALGADFPIVAWPHELIRNYQALGLGSAESYRAADAVFVLNEIIRQEIAPVIAPDRIYRIRNAVDASNIVYATGRDPHRLGFVGRIEYPKNLPLALHALSLVQEEWQLTVVGEGDLDEMKELCGTLGLTERVHFAGWSDHPWELLADAGIFLMSSRYEAAPLTVIEALSCGMAVVSTPVGNVPEVVRPGENGYLYENGNPQALAGILTRIWAGELLLPSAEACRQSVGEYRQEVVLKDFQEKLESLL